MDQPQTAEKTCQQQFLARLKQDTSSQHEALERNPHTAVLVRHDLSFPAYLNVLKRFYGFILPVEDQVYPLLNQELGDTEVFKRGHLLKEDLSALGLSQQAISALPRLHSLPSIHTTAAAFGMVYVLEGSKLGGQFISRQVNQVLRLTPEQGLRFFNGHGREAGHFWNEFRQAMANYAVTTNQQDVVIAAAAQTFEAFKTWLESEVA